MADLTTKTEPGGKAPLLRAIALALGAACAVLTIVFLIDVTGAMSVRVTDTLVHDRLGGSVIDHSIRIRQGLPLYAEPDDHFVPLVYTPIYYYLAAGSMSVLGEGATAGRVTSLALVLGSLLVAVALIRRTTGGWAWAAAALPIAAAGYPISLYYYDWPRPDPASTFAVLLAVWMALRSRSLASGAALGILLCVAYFSKQSTLVFALLFLPAVFLDHPRRGIVAAVVFATLTGACVGLANLATDGWFWTYCIYLPTQHELPLERIWILLRDDWGGTLVLPTATLLVVGVALLRKWKGTEHDRDVRLVLFAAVAVAAFSTASHVRTGATPKVLMPFCLMAAAAVPIALGWLDASMRSASGKWIVRGAGALIIGSFLLQHRFDASDALPTAEDRARWDELHEIVAGYAAEGQVWVAPCGYFTTSMKGQEMRPMMIALEDYLGVRGNATGQPIPPAMRTAIEDRAFSAIVFPLTDGGFRPLRELVKTYYEPRPRTIGMNLGMGRLLVPMGIFTPRAASNADDDRDPGGAR